MATTVGAFTFDGETLTGPAAYMQSDSYKDCLRSILNNTNVVLNAGASGLSPNYETALLVAVQTDYAAWLGAQSLRRRLSA